jgi:hypothetical protein
VVATSFVGNVSAVTVSASGNIDGGNLRTGGLISATGTITGSAVSAGAGALTGGSLSVTGTITGANITGGNLLTSGLVTATGNIISAGTIITGGGSGGNITGANVISAVTLSATGNVQAGNVRTTGNVSVTGNVTATSFVGNVVANTVISTSYPTVLDDITNQFDSVTAVFRLTVNTANVTTIVDSKNLMVSVGGQTLAPYVQPITWPFFPEYDSWRGFRVRNSPPGSGNVVVGSNVIIYNSPAIGSDCSLTIINNSATVQTRRYPFAPTTIALEVD